MKISVIIPVYNGERWVAQCIENVLCQTYKELEILVVDDGSTDRTAEIAARYPVTLLRQANAGASAARNRGIEAAGGEYLHFLDVDDWINLDFYARMAEAAALTDADMAFGGYVHELLPHWTRIYTDRYLIVDPKDKFEITGAAKDGQCWRYIIRKSFLDDHALRFDAGLLIEDRPFTVEAVCKANKIVTVPGALYYYKNRAGSIMRSTDPAKKRKRAQELAKSNGIRDGLLREYGLEDVPTGITLLHRFQYKILGIPMLEKRLYDSGKTRWVLFGLYVMQLKKRLKR